MKILEKLVEEAMEARNKSDYNEFEQIANKILSAIEETKQSVDDKEKLEKFRAKAYLYLANVNTYRGAAEKSFDFSNKALLLAERYNWTDLLPLTYHILGQGHKSLGNNDYAIEYFSKAILIYSELGDKSKVSRVLFDLSTTHENKSQFDKALEYAYQSLTLEEELANHRLIASRLGDIGRIYQKLNDNDKAIELLTKALKQHEEFANYEGVAETIGNIGVLYYYQAKFNLAIENFQKALQFHERADNMIMVATVIGNIGTVYAAENMHEEAIESFSKALQIHEDCGDKLGVARCLGNIGDIYSNKSFHQYDFEEAKSYISKAIELSDAIHSKSQSYSYHKSLSDLCKGEGKWEEAFSHFQKYHELEKEVQGQEVKIQAQQLDNRRKAEETERDRIVKIARFQEQEKILLNILPAQIAERILEGEKRIADLHENISVFFSDIVGFTKLSQTVTPDELLTMLNEIFSEFDRIARKHGLEKIKTIGDAYMAVAGVPMAQEDHAERAATFALDVIEYMKEYRKTSKSDLQIRVGLHTGRAIAGVIGENKFAYDLWGDSINTASRMESHGEAGRVHVSEDFRNALKSNNFQFINRGDMEVKGKGMMKTYFLEQL